jgi:prevent-host-death family protein
MQFSITEFRRNIFSVVQKAMEGDEVWVSHKGRRFRIVPENASSKLSRITPMDIIAPDVDLEDDSWKEETVREWEQKWDRRLGPLSDAPRKAPRRNRVSARQIRRKS